MDQQDFLLEFSLNIVIDRELGSKHPEYGFIYLVNYGYVPDTTSRDGKELDCYLLGVFKPVKAFKGNAILLLLEEQTDQKQSDDILVEKVRNLEHKIKEIMDDDDDKLIIVSKNKEYSDDAINALVEFQKRYFEHIIVR